MQPFTQLTAIAAPLDLANVDTDKIVPARYLRKPREGGYGQYLFHDLRFDSQGSERPDFVLNQSAWRNAQILVASVNFGCGSSREAAVYALMDFGIRSVIASSFGDIHYGNELQNGMLPVILPEATCAALRAQLHARPGVQISVSGIAGRNRCGWRNPPLRYRSGLPRAAPEGARRRGPHPRASARDRGVRAAPPRRNAVARMKEGRKTAQAVSRQGCQV